jgi:hypothetical protein
MTSTPTTPTDLTATRPKKHGRGPFVISMILVAGLLFIATEVLLYYRWATMTEPTCVLIVETAGPLKGAQVMVDGITLAQPHKVTVGEDDRYALPFYVEPGRYTVKVTQNDQILFEREVEVSNKERGKKFDLTKLPPAATQQTTPQLTFP